MLPQDDIRFGKLAEQVVVDHGLCGAGVAAIGPAVGPARSSQWPLPAPAGSKFDPVKTIYENQTLTHRVVVILVGFVPRASEPTA